MHRSTAMQGQFGTRGLSLSIEFVPSIIPKDWLRKLSAWLTAASEIFPWMVRGYQPDEPQRGPERAAVIPLRIMDYKKVKLFHAFLRRPEITALLNQHCRLVLLFHDILAQQVHDATIPMPWFSTIDGWGVGQGRSPPTQLFGVGYMDINDRFVPFDHVIDITDVDPDTVPHPPTYDH